MNISLSFTPAGRLAIATADDSSSVAGADEIRLREALAESNAGGLLVLASEQLRGELPPTLVYFRDLARRLFQAICQLGEAEFSRWADVAAPDDEQLAQLVAEAPPMHGLEYLRVDVLRSLWRELASRVAADAAEFADGPAAYLRSINPLWHLLGRVTFHLAENKRDPDRPFAFMATYTHELSGQARLRHLPLADALRTYAGAADQQKLESLLEPVRRCAQRSPLIRKLLDSRAIFAPQAWSIDQAYKFLQETKTIEEAGVVVRVPDWWTPRKPPRPQVQLRLGSQPARNMGVDGLLDFQVELSIDGDPLTPAERRQLLAGDVGLRLLRGKWVEVDQQQLRQAMDHWQRLRGEHPDGLTFIEGMRLLSGAQFDQSQLADESTGSWSRVVAGDWLRDTLRSLRQPDTIDECRPGRDLQATLRPYQDEGVRWLWFMTRLGLGACLADDMGLGKTIQVIDLLLQRKRQVSARGADATAHKPSLLVVPASLIGNWKSELARFAPALRAMFVHRAEQDADTMTRFAEQPRAIAADYDLIVTTYGLVRRVTSLRDVEWSLVILDEAQAIKNPGSAQTKSVKKLPASCRLALTGTPVENHLGDLWSLFDFCLPGLLGSAGDFKSYLKRLGKQQDAHAFRGLRQLVRPYILRRLKTDPTIAPDLPDKTEMRTECGLSRRQAVLYEHAVQELAERLKDSTGIARKGAVLSTLQQLKQICNHPDQFAGRADFAAEDSGKFERLRLLCEPIVERQERMLVFTQFQSLTEPLARYLATLFGRAGLVLHGGTPVKKRTELVREFQAEGGPPFFVISLKAGGSGLNLTAASHVVHFDRWWNPAVENQATDRAFRIGQKRNVLVHKFVCRGTLEERIDAMLQAKQQVADQVLNDESETRLTELSDDELLRFVSLDIGRATADE